MRFAAIILLALTSYTCAFGSGIDGGLCNTGVVGPCLGPNGYGSSYAPIGGEQNWVLLGGVAYVPGNPPSPPWIPNTNTSQWISASNNYTATPGTLTYQLTFLVGSLAVLDPAAITGRYASSNELLSIALNGQAVAGFPLNSALNGFETWTGFAIPNTANFILGANTITWTVRSSPTNHGFRVEFGESSPLDGVPEPPGLLLGALGLTGLWIARRYGLGIRVTSL